MVLLLAAKPVDGWCSVDPVKALSILSTLIPKPVKQPSPFAKEEKKEDKKGREEGRTRKETLWWGSWFRF
jgi:hypothetical protein